MPLSKARMRERKRQDRSLNSKATQVKRKNVQPNSLDFLNNQYIEKQVPVVQPTIDIAVVLKNVKDWEEVT